MLFGNNFLIVGILVGFHEAQACVENHARCLESHTWKYRTLRTFHHISSAESCQSECSKFQSRVNYFSFDVSIHRCLCIANCLIDRGTHTKNDVVGTITDVDPSGLCQAPDIPSPEKKSIDPIILGVTQEMQVQSYNLATNTTSFCDVPSPSGKSDTRFSVIGYQLHACSKDALGSKPAVTCRKFDDTKKVWEDVSHIIIQWHGTTFLALPNGNIVIVFLSRYLYLYDGKNIKMVSEHYPFTDDSNYQAPLCLTVLSNEEIVVGLTVFVHDGSPFADKHLYIVNLESGNVTKGRPIEIDLCMPSCAAFGPEGDRKIFIYNGVRLTGSWYYENFPDTIVFDPKSWDFTLTGYQWHKTAFDPGFITPYGDTFLQSFDDSEEALLMFDYKGTTPRFLDMGTLFGGFRLLSTVPSNSGFTCG